MSENKRSHHQFFSFLWETYFDVHFFFFFDEAFELGQYSSANFETYQLVLLFRHSLLAEFSISCWGNLRAY